MKKIYFFLIFCSLLIFKNSYGQNVGFEWQQVYGGTTIDQPNSINATIDGGTIIAGYSTSNNVNVSGSHGGGDYWIVKLNISGAIEWQKCLGGTGNDRGQYIEQTKDSGYIVTGSSRSNDGDVTGHHGLTLYEDVWVVKLDSTGNIQWQKSLGGTSVDRSNCVRQTPDKGYIVAAYSFSNDGDVSGNHGSYDFWIVKLDSAGTIQWQKSLGGTTIETSNYIEPTNDGGYIVTGESNSNDGDVSGHHGGTGTGGNFDIWVVKLDSAGTIEWQKSIGGIDHEDGNSIKQIADGNYIFSGHTKSNDGDFSGNNGGTDFCIVKLDTAGNIIWQNLLGGSGSDLAYSFVEDLAGGYVLAGTSYSNNGDVTGHHGLLTMGDSWIVKVDTTGNPIWQKSLGGTNNDQANAICQTSDGHYIIASDSYSNNEDVPLHIGGVDFWIVKLSCVFNYTPVITAPSGLILCNGGTLPLTTDSASGYKWSNGGFNQSTLVDSFGTHTMVVYDNAGCASHIGSITVTTNNVNLPSTVQVCQGDSITLNAGNGFVSYVWSTGDFTQTTHGFPGNTYYVTVTNTASCQSIDSIKVLTVLLPVINLGPDKLLCPMDSATISAGPGYSSYLWSTGYTGQSITGYPVNNYWVRVTNNLGCKNIDTIGVLIKPLPLLNLGNDTTVCATQLFTLNAPGFSNYSWTSSMGGSSIDSTFSVEGGLFGTPNIITCSAYNSCYQVYDTLEVNGKEIAIIISCDSTGVTLDAGPGFASYSWLFNLNPFDTSQAVLINDSGVYIIHVVDTTGCPAVSQYLIGTFFQVADFTYTSNDDTVIFNCPVNDVTYFWDFGDGDTSTLQNPVHIYAGDGNYTVTLDVTNSCGTDSYNEEIIIILGVYAVVNVPGVTVFPNPFSNQTTIHFEKEQENASLKIVDLLGKEMKTINFSGTDLILKRDEMKDGLYFMYLSTKNNRYQLRTKLVVAGE